MIGRITGILLEKQAPELLVEAQGVGYEVHVSMNTFFALPASGEKVVLHTHFVVREDAQQLFGFASVEERGLFRSLIKISGVGPKMALAILSGMSVADFVRCVRGGDVASLTKLPGVGTKTAERLLVEMKDRLGKWESSTGFHGSPQFAAGGAPLPREEAESALVALGYKPQEAARMISRVEKDLGDDSASSETLIRAALKNAVK
ncbi:MAG: Holliday junction branch migration protein RuvA [Porticoccaceae bacterium]|nr:Holliday junction branch migration protein RuvA [Porticoccaceae bacterium]